MAQRKNKERKEKLENYKNLKKMSKETPEMRPFQQVPTWESNETFTIQGSELDALYRYFNIFAPAFTSVQQIFSRGVQEGKIQIGYQYEDGSPVPDEDIKAYTEKLNAYFKKRMAETDPESAENVEDIAEKPKSKIVNMHGVQATEENV